MRDRKSRPRADCGPCSMKESDLKGGLGRLRPRISHLPAGLDI